MTEIAVPAPHVTVLDALAGQISGHLNAAAVAGTGHERRA
jgi:hypothetical protein